MLPTPPKNEVVVYDDLQPCSYLPGLIARLPHRFPAKRLSLATFDARLAEGDRRNGVLLYRPQCPNCTACEPIRIDVDAFRPRENQRRAQRRGDELLRLEIGEPIVDDARVELFNRHRHLRGLERQDGPIDADSYAQFLTDSCCTTVEFSYYLDDQLMGVAIVDLGEQAASAVYCFYEPTFRGVSLGTYSVLKQIEFCQQTARRHLYLGFYIAVSQHMVYKGLFRPHERLVNGTWQHFEAEPRP